MNPSRTRSFRSKVPTRMAVSGHARRRVVTSGVKTLGRKGKSWSCCRSGWLRSMLTPDSKSARLLTPYADYSWSTSARPTPPACATSRRSRSSSRCSSACGDRGRRLARRRVPLLVKIAPDLADDDVARRGRHGARDRPGRHHRHQHDDLPSRPAHPDRARSRRSAPAGSPAARSPSARWRCCGCCAAASART